jgi:hypothetical protein
VTEAPERSGSDESRAAVPTRADGTVVVEPVTGRVRYDTPNISENAMAAPIPSGTRNIGEGPRQRGVLVVADEDIDSHHDKENGEIRNREMKELHGAGDVRLVHLGLTPQLERTPVEPRAEN